MAADSYLSEDDMAVAESLYADADAKMRDIIAQVSRATGVSEDAIHGGSRVAHIAAARQIVMSIARRQGMSTARIGKLLKRDHTTVLHGIAAHDRRVREARGREC